MIESPGTISSEGNEITGTERVPRIICLFIQPGVYVLPVIWLPLQQSSGKDWVREMKTLGAGEGRRVPLVSSLTCIRTRVQFSQVPEALQRVPGISGVRSHSWCPGEPDQKSCLGRIGGKHAICTIFPCLAESCPNHWPQTPSTCPHINLPLSWIYFVVSSIERRLFHFYCLFFYRIRSVYSSLLFDSTRGFKLPI